MKRDGGCCPLTKDAYAVRVCRIFPFYLGRNRVQKSIDLWSVLEMFWGKEKVATCQEIIFGPPDSSNTYINRLDNLFTLNVSANALWNMGYIALKHIRGGSYQMTTEMVLELEWLAPRT